MYIMIVTSFLHFGWCTLFVSYLKLNVEGVAYATIITFFLNFLLITLISKFNKHLRHSFFFITRESFHNMGEYLKLGLPSCFMLCIEWWSFEVLAIMAGYISVDATAAHVVVLNTHVVLIMIPIGA